MSQPEFYFIICPDSGLIKQQIIALQKQYPPSNGGGSSLLVQTSETTSWKTHTYWGDEELPPSFWENLMMQGLFASPKMLILRNAHSINTQTWKELAEALENPNQLSFLVICLECAWEKSQAKIPAHIAKQKVLEIAEKKSWIWKNLGLDFKSVRAYIQNRASAMGLILDSYIIDSLCSSISPDANAIDNELEKLRLATPLEANGRVRSDMVDLGSNIPDSDIFAFIDAIFAGNMPSVWAKIYNNKHELDALLFPVLALLVREAKIFWQILAGDKVYLHPSSAAKKKNYAKILGFAGVAKMFDSIIQAELAIKSGTGNVEQTLETLIVKIMLIFKPQR